MSGLKRHFATASTTGVALQRCREMFYDDKAKIAEILALKLNA